MSSNQYFSRSPPSLIVSEIKSTERDQGNKCQIAKHFPFIFFIQSVAVFLNKVVIFMQGLTLTSSVYQSKGLVVQELNQPFQNFGSPYNEGRVNGWSGWGGEGVGLLTHEYFDAKSCILSYIFVIWTISISEFQLVKLVLATPSV